MDIRPSVSVDEVKFVLTHPAIYDRIAEDNTPDAEDYAPSPDAIYLMGYDNGYPFACMVYHQINGVTWECHVQVLPEYRKTHADEFSQLAIQWMLNKGVRKLVAQIPMLYPNVMQFGLKHGFVVEGINRQSYLKHGQLHDQWYLGLVG